MTHFEKNHIGSFVLYNDSPYYPKKHFRFICSNIAYTPYSSPASPNSMFVTKIIFLMQYSGLDNSAKFELQRNKKYNITNNELIVFNDIVKSYYGRDRCKIIVPKS